MSDSLPESSHRRRALVLRSRLIFLMAFPLLLAALALWFSSEYRRLGSSEDETLRADSLNVVQQLREAGKAVDYSLTPAKGDKQFKRALELGAAHTVRLERGADGAVVAKVKNLKTREERAVEISLNSIPFLTF